MNKRTQLCELSNYLHRQNEKFCNEQRCRMAHVFQSSVSLMKVASYVGTQSLRPAHTSAVAAAL